MKLKLCLAFLLAVPVILALGPAVTAQEQPPAPYAGLKNPFPWTDSGAQSAGLGVYRQFCLGCHGVGGEGITGFDFSKTDFGQSLESGPDFYFWVVSEGRMSKGMPAFKGSLSEEQRWQLLTYIRSLSIITAGPAATIPSGEAVQGYLALTVPQAEVGKSDTIKVFLRDEQDKPIVGASIKFYLNISFFATGLMEIGDAVTNDRGLATLDYVPRQDGQVKVVARYGASETRATMDVAPGIEPYAPEAGLQLPESHKGGIIYPDSVLDLGPGTRAPLPAFRLPGGILSWLLLLVGTVAMIYFTYVRVMYQIYRIPITSEIRDINTRLVPTIGMVLLASIGVALIMKLLISPYSHLHIPPY